MAYEERYYKEKMVKQYVDLAKNIMENMDPEKILGETRAKLKEHYLWDNDLESKYRSINNKYHRNKRRIEDMIKELCDFT